MPFRRFIVLVWLFASLFAGERILSSDESEQGAVFPDLSQRDFSLYSADVDTNSEMEVLPSMFDSAYFETTARRDNRILRNYTQSPRLIIETWSQLGFISHYHPLHSLFLFCIDSAQFYGRLMRFNI